MTCLCGQRDVTLDCSAPHKHCYLHLFFNGCINSDACLETNIKEKSTLLLDSPVPCCPVSFSTPHRKSHYQAGPAAKCLVTVIGSSPSDGLENTEFITQQISGTQSVLEVWQICQMHTLRVNEFWFKISQFEYKVFVN